jgi:hypothetical protein
MLFSIEGPVTIAARAFSSSRSLSSFQKRSSGQASTFSVRLHWM